MFCAATLFTIITILVAVFTFIVVVVIIVVVTKGISIGIAKVIISTTSRKSRRTGIKSVVVGIVVVVVVGIGIVGIPPIVLFSLAFTVVATGH
tara:strand:+ start:267 stop:545 length:279 start_codon:yes stop_codon:yes gene_type:complete